MNLKPRALILLAIDAFGGQVGGKTLLQKRLYFTEVVLKESLGFEFDTHYYGPYSSLISSELATLKLQGQLREDASTYGVSDQSGFEMRRYQYELTAAGRESVQWIRQNFPQEAKRVSEAAQRVVAAGNLDYMDLSFAAKSHWIICHANKPLSPKEIAGEAKSFGWKVEPQQLDQGIKFLLQLGLVQSAPS